MNRTPRTENAPLSRRPGQLVAGLIGAVLLLMGGVPLAERLLAHLTLWGTALSLPGLPQLVLFAGGATLLALFWRRRYHTAPDPRDR